MNYILIKGAADAGKSTTIQHVCQRLQPISIQQLKSGQRFEKVALDTKILNGTYLLLVNNKMMLVSAGAPTEQRITITVLIEICISLNIKIGLALVAMRSVERTEGFSTKRELEKLGTCIWEQRIYKIDGDNYQHTTEWKERVDSIVLAAKSVSYA
jgi:hypothetical protein